MPRPQKSRRICCYPDYWSFAPDMGSADAAVASYIANTLVQNPSPTCDHHGHGEGRSCGNCVRYAAGLVGEMI